MNFLSELRADTPTYILVIEDNPADIDLLRIGLDECRQAYDLRILRDGEEALLYVHQERAANLDNPRPCVIVLDLHIPRHNGIAVLEAIRDTPALTHIHVVVFTSAATPTEKHEATRLGVRLFLEKPTDLDQFIEAARCILDICNEAPKAHAAIP